MEYTSRGFIQIRTFEAEEAMPTPNVFIKITGNEEFNLGTEVSTITDRSGLSEKIELPAPERVLSLSPGAPEKPFSTYDIEASADGYYPKKVLNVAIFSGILSILPLQMIPNSGIKNNVTPPKGSNYSISKENEELE